MARVPNTITLPDGRRVVCRIFDSGPDKHADRYTVAFKAKRGWRGNLYYPYISADDRPFHPQGFGQHGENPDFLKGKHLGKRIAFADCPPDVQRFILMQFTSEHVRFALSRNTTPSKEIAP